VRFGLTTRATHGRVVYVLTGLTGDLGAELAWMTEGDCGSLASLELCSALTTLDSTPVVYLNLSLRRELTELTSAADRVMLVCHCMPPTLYCACKSWG
jgi:hypothetical protein